MTLEEKVGQLNLVSHGPPLRWEDISEGKAGALLNFNSAPDVARAQALARQSRLKIPPLFGLDVLHGFRTQFPLPLGEAAAFSPRISRLASEWAAKEAAYVGVNWTFAPMADLSRDSRWGRIVEGFGEDPTLGAALTAARVEGFRKGGLAAAAKHFAGYGAPAGRARLRHHLHSRARKCTTPICRRSAPRWRPASASFMAAFNALNGEPSTANPWLLTDVLRKQWGFDGFVTSDWVGIGELINHGIAADGAEAARKAILAGVDMDMMGLLYIKHLPDEVRAGRVPESVIDESVRRVLRTKFRMGLFDRPDIDPSRLDCGLPVAGIAPGRPRGGARNLRAAAEPRRRAAVAAERPLRSRWSAPSPTRRTTRWARMRRAGTRRTASRSSKASAAAPQGSRHRRAPCSGLRPVLPQYGGAARRPSTRRSDPIS